MGMPRSLQTWKSLRVCASTPLALSISMTARVGGRQRAVGVLGEVLVAGRVEQVDAEAAVRELQDAELVTEMPRSRSISIQSEVTCRCAPARLDGAGEMDGAAVEKELLGERRLAGVGMGDDGEGAATLRLHPQLLFGVHGSIV